jgi:IclR family mhp operon transcriptional activator
MDEGQEIKSLKKALNALTFMNQEGHTTVSSLAAAIGVPRTTAFRLLETLASEGYIEKSPHSRYYRLTSQVLRLSSGFQEESHLIEAAAPKLTRLGKEVGWSLSLSTPLASEMVVRLTTNFNTAMVLDRFAVGYRVPILYTTTGLCFLALCSEAERTAVLELARQSKDPRQQLVHDEVRLKAILSRIRERGFSVIEHPEYREGNVGVPLTIDGRVVGGIVMRYIKSAMRLEKMLSYYVPLLKELSHDVQSECEVRLTDHSGRRPAAMRGVLTEPDYREWLDLH